MGPTLRPKPAFFRASLLACVCGAALALSGCAGTDVELEGGVFDLLGISGSALTDSNKEPKVAARNPLVVPPRTDRLPQPGTQPATVAQQQPWPVDPEARKVAMAKDAAKKRKAHCQGSTVKDGEAVRDVEWYDKLSGQSPRCAPPWGAIYSRKAEGK